MAGVYFRDRMQDVYVDFSVTVPQDVGLVVTLTFSLSVQRYEQVYVKCTLYK